MAMSLHDLRAVPLYDQDLDGEAAPEPVRALKEAIAAADGLVIVSPEYNHRDSRRAEERARSGVPARLPLTSWSASRS